MGILGYPEKRKPIEKNLPCVQGQFFKWNDRYKEK